MDNRAKERAVLILDGYELNALLEVLAGLENATPRLAESFAEPALGEAWQRLTKKIVGLVGPHGETTAPSGTERLH